MIRKYMRGDVRRVLAQKAQEDEVSLAVLEFDQVGAYTQVSDDGDVLAVFGYAVVEEGVADCYALFSADVGGRLIEAVRFLDKAIALFAKQLQLSVVRMTVKKGFAEGVRFARMIGFEFAAVLPHFYLGNDYQLFERIIK